MEMHQIRYFLALSHTLNFTRAAEACNVSQPSLTRAIKLLEVELGGDLFRRERALTHLTDLGKRLLPVLRRCCDAAIEARTAAKSYAKSGGASLEIAVAAGIGADILARHLKRIARELPGVEINLHRGSAAEVLDLLKKGDVETAVAAGLDGSWDRLDSWQLGTERHNLVVNASHAFAGSDEIEPSALAGERLLSLPGASQIDALVAQIGADAVARREIATTDDIVSLVEAGIGIAILPERTTLPMDLVRVDIAGTCLDTTISLHAVAGRQRSAAAQALIKIVRADSGAGARGRDQHRLSAHASEPACLAASA